MAFLIGAQLQVLFGLMVMVAAALFVAWIIMFKPDQLKMWMIFLFVLGSLGMVVSAVLLSGPSSSLGVFG